MPRRVYPCLDQRRNSSISSYIEKREIMKDQRPSAATLSLFMRKRRYPHPFPEFLMWEPDPKGKKGDKKEQGGGFA